MLPKLLRKYKNPFAHAYSEDWQARPCRFAFAKQRKDGTYVVDPFLAKCRDFLNDTLVWRAKVPGTPPRIYGYSFKGAIDTKQVCVMVDNYGDLKDNIGVLNELERELGLQETKIIEVEEVVRNGDFPAVIVVADKWWQKTTVQFSWWHHVIRLLTYPKGTDILTKLEGWANPHSKVFFEIPKAMRDAPDLGVCGTKLESIKEMHSYNGWGAQLCPYKTKYTTYGEYLRGKLYQA